MKKAWKNGPLCCFPCLFNDFLFDSTQFRLNLMGGIALMNERDDRSTLSRECRAHNSDRRKRGG